MKNAALFVVGLLSASVWLHETALCQTSRAPPLSLARPAPSSDETAPPPAIIRASPPMEADDTPPPKATAKRPAAPVAASNVPSPKPAADYDGFSVGAVADPAPKAPAKPRAANRSKSTIEPGSGAKQPELDYGDDDQLKRKLTICRDCK
jgi:hypothetical protein